MRPVDVIAVVLLIVGGLNWGLVGVASFDLVAGVFGAGSIVSKIVYTLVGVAAVYLAIAASGMQNRWRAAPARA